MALARADLRAATEYTLALQEHGAERGLVAFNALLVRLALGTLAAIRDKRPGQQAHARRGHGGHRGGAGRRSIEATRRCRPRRGRAASRPRSERAGRARRALLVACVSPRRPARPSRETDALLPAADVHDRPQRGQHLRLHAGLPAHGDDQDVGQLHHRAQRQLEQLGRTSPAPFATTATSRCSTPGTSSSRRAPIINRSTLVRSTTTTARTPGAR